MLADPRRRGARCCARTAPAAQWLHPGFKLVLHRDEPEGYYLNVSAPQPRVFVLWRMEERATALPLDVTVSSDEGGRWLDGGHSVDGVAMPRGDLRVGRRLRGEELPARAEEAHQAALVPASEGPASSDGDEEKEAFLDRWSRLKKEQEERLPEQNRTKRRRRRCRRSTS